MVHVATAVFLLPEMVASNASDPLALAQGPKRCISDEHNHLMVIYLSRFLCLFESFWKRFESEGETVDLATFKYYLVCRFVNTTRILPLKFPLLLTQVPLPLTINSPRKRISGFNLTAARRE